MLRKPLVLLLSLLIFVLLAACKQEENPASEKPPGQSTPQSAPSAAPTPTAEPSATESRAPESSQGAWKYPFDVLVDGKLYLDYPVAENGNVAFYIDEKGKWVLEFVFLKMFDEFGEENEGACFYSEDEQKLEYHVTVTTGGLLVNCVIDAKELKIKESSIKDDSKTQQGKGSASPIGDERLLEIGSELWKIMQKAEKKYSELMADK